jgi:hypothetical protein
MGMAGCREWGGGVGKLSSGYQGMPTRPTLVSSGRGMGVTVSCPKLPADAPLAHRCSPSLTD